MKSIAVAASVISAAMLMVACGKKEEPKVETPAPVAAPAAPADAAAKPAEEAKK
jgi:hypothetical protein